MGVALLESFAGLFATCMGALADTLYLTAVAPDSAAPSSSSLFLYKAVVSATRYLYANPPPPAAHVCSSKSCVWTVFAF